MHHSQTCLLQETLQQGVTPAHRVVLLANHESRSAYIVFDDNGSVGSEVGFGTLEELDEVIVLDLTYHPLHPDAGVLVQGAEVLESLGVVVFHLGQFGHQHLRLLNVLLALVYQVTLLEVLAKQVLGDSADA